MSTRHAWTRAPQRDRSSTIAAGERHDDDSAGAFGPGYDALRAAYIVVASDKQMHRVVILGGGFGGLYAAQALRRAPVEVTLVDRRNFHLFQPLLYQVATGSLSAGEIAGPLRVVLRDQKNAGVLLGEAVDLDAENRRL